MIRNWRSAGALLALLLASPALLAAQDAGDDGDLLPVGLGNLSQDDLAIRLRTDALEIRFVPLDERMIRLLAPDAYRSLHALRMRERSDIDSISREHSISAPSAVLVSFYARQTGTRFQPELLTVGLRSRQLYPLGIIPLNPAFSSQQLDLRQPATAIYLYEDELPIAEPFTVTYGGVTSNEWQRKLPTLERERARIGSRVARDTTPR
jgi:hypothetical protein